MLELRLYGRKGVVEHVDGPTAVTVGVFDGVHCGHRLLLEQLRRESDGLRRVAVTLTSHPSFVLGRRQSEYWLDDPDEHRHELLEAGVDFVAELPFTREVASLTATALVREMHERLQMRTLLVGYDGRFGNKENDDFDHIPALAHLLGIRLLQGKPYRNDGLPVSSSRIREALEKGDVNKVTMLMGRPYSVCGQVTHGRGVGHALGFPTANIDLRQTRKMLPREGVYAVKLRPQTSYLRPLTGMANLGPLPTFGIEKPTLEVHLLDFDGDLYGQSVEVQFIQRLRDTVRFDSVEALQRQLQEDLNNCQQICRQDAGAPKQ